MKNRYASFIASVATIFFACSLPQTGRSQPCSGLPTGGTVTPVSAVVCNSVVTLSGGGYTVAQGISFQWQYNPTGLNWINYPGATSTTFTIGQTGAYRLMVYCANSGQAAFSTPANITACQDSVWPGDANYDHIADNNDILAIGLAFGNTGPARAITGNVYQADFAANWSATYYGGINMKHADCNGDGLVDWADTTAVNLNYGLSHPKGAETPAARGAGLPDLIADLSGITLVPGNTYTVPIRFGSSAAPVQKFYGLAGSLRIGGASLQAAPAVTFGPSWLGGMNQLVHLSHPVNADRVDFAIARTSHHDTTGYGAIGNVTFTMPPAAGGKLILSFQNVTLIDSGGHVLSGYNVVADTANIQSVGVHRLSNKSFEAGISPNPGSNSVVNINAVNNASAQIIVYDATGRKVFEKQAFILKGANQVTLPRKELPAGYYTVQVIIDSILVLLKWIKE